MSKGGGDTQTIQKADPWAGQQPFLLDIFKQAQQRQQAPGPNYFPSSTVAGFTPDTMAAQGLARTASGAQAGIAGLGTQGLQYQIGQAIDPASNPFFARAVEGAIRPVVQQFTDPGGPLAQIRSGFGAAGQFGSSRQGIAEGVATGRLGQALLDTTAQMGSQAFGQGLEAQARGLALLPQIQSAQAAPATTLDAVGQQNQAMSQAVINDAIARWNWEQQLPDAKLAQYQNLVQGSFGGQLTGTSTGAQGNPFLGAVGGAASGYALASMMPALGITGPIGAGIGLMLGLFGSF